MVRALRAWAFHKLFWLTFFVKDRCNCLGKPPGRRSRHCLAEEVGWLLYRFTFWVEGGLVYPPWRQPGLAYLAEAFGEKEAAAN